MSRSLGIFVSSNQHMDKIISLCRAAKKKDVDVTLFFTHLGVLLAQDPRFVELAEMGSLSFCRVGFESHGLKTPMPGVDERELSSQIRHAELIMDCDRYVVF
jgi:hypothetical protein